MKKNYCKPLRLSPTISLSYTRTHTMAKASNSKKPTSESSQTGKKRAPKSSKPAESKPKQLEWGSNPTWIQRAIEHLTCDVKFRLRLFSDTTSGAKAEGRSKV